MADAARPRVTGGSILVGNFSFSSPDGSVEFDGGPAQGQISAKVPGLPFMPGGVIVRAFPSEILDAGEADAEVALFPALTGYLGFATNIQPVYATGAGGIVEVASTWSIGNNVARDNWLASTAGPVAVSDPDAIARAELAYSSFFAPGQGAQLTDLGAPPFAKIISPATGTAMTALVRLLTTVVLFVDLDL